jgi:hypothetical protein
VVHDEVDSDYSIVRARARCAGGLGRRPKNSSSNSKSNPVATASTYNDNALYTSKWTTTEQWSEALGLVHPNVVKPVCRIYCVAQRGRPSPIIFTSAAATTSVLARQF